jgi:C1A family cysteine protease
MKKILIFSIIILIIFGSLSPVTISDNLNDQQKEINQESLIEKYDHINYPVMTDPLIASDIKNINIKGFQINTDLPESYSWLNYDGYDWSTPVKNQGNCGSCWDFAAIGTLESIIKIRENRPDINPDLSEQYALSCLPASANNYGQGCLGGTPYNAFYWIMNSSEEGNYQNGVISEDCFNYYADHNIPCDDKCNDWVERLIPINDCGELWVGFDNEEARSTVKTFIYEYGPISAGMNVSSEFTDYFRFRHNPNDYFPDPDMPWGNRLNHIIVIMGWKDDSSIPNGGYWICKNSWGADWGYDGFFNIEYGGLFTGTYISWVDYVAQNSYPQIPDIPNGEINGEVESEYTYTTTSTDIDSNELFYLFDWGDDTNSGWIGPYESDEIVSTSHTWLQRGNYYIKVKVKDELDQESGWSDPFEVSMPNNKNLFMRLKLFNFLNLENTLFYQIISKIL